MKKCLIWYLLLANIQTSLQPCYSRLKNSETDKNVGVFLWKDEEMLRNNVTQTVSSDLPNTVQLLSCNEKRKHGRRRQQLIIRPPQVRWQTDSDCFQWLLILLQIADTNTKSLSNYWRNKWHLKRWNHEKPKSLSCMLTTVSPGGIYLCHTVPEARQHPSTYLTW